MATRPDPSHPAVPDVPVTDDDNVTEIITETLGSIPTRVIVVEELHNCGVISEKKMRKRIQRIMEEMELKSVTVETLGDES
jgi:hypothetical protein